MSYTQVRDIPTAEQVTKLARPAMVQRLNMFARDDAELFSAVVQMIKRDFLHIITRQVRSRLPLPTEEEQLEECMNQSSALTTTSWFLSCGVGAVTGGQGNHSVELPFA